MRRWGGPLGILAIVLLGQSMAKAQAVSDTGTWLAAFGNGNLAPKLDDRLKWWFDGQLRFFEETEGFGQSVVRPGVGYALKENVIIWAGYGWFVNARPGSPDISEDRVWEQVTWSKPFDIKPLGLRSRLEQRFLQNGDDVGGRFRQLASWRQPIARSKRFSFVLSDEIFVHLNDTDWGSDAGFDQNRCFVGIGLKHRPESRWTMDIGYLNQHINRPRRGNLTNHLLSVNFAYGPKVSQRVPSQVDDLLSVGEEN
ncbi:DUF2490 domain-containing protein [Kolteria novifilia]